MCHCGWYAASDFSALFFNACPQTNKRNTDFVNLIIERDCVFDTIFFVHLSKNLLLQKSRKKKKTTAM